MVADVVQRALNPVEDVVHDPGAQLDLERRLSPLHGVANRKARRVLVALNRRGVSDQLNNLPHKLVRPNAHQLVHRSALHLLRDDDCTQQQHEEERRGRVW